MKTQVGTCPQCGAPIYAPSIWFGITPPPSEYTCTCNVGSSTVITTTNVGTVDLLSRDKPELPKELEADFPELYNWIFHHNHHTKTWNAFTRDDHNKYFDGKAESVVTSRDINLLINIILRGGGNPEKIKQLTISG